MRHPQGGSLTAERQAFRERVRTEAAVMFAEGRGSTDIAKELRVSVRSVVLGAWIVFEDQAGFPMTPPTSRTWSQRGTAPVIRVRGRSQRRFSIATLCCYKPGERSRLIYRPKRHAGHKSAGRKSFARTEYRDLLIAAHQQLDAPWSVLRRTTQANTAVTDPSRLIHRLRHGLRQIQYRSDTIDGCLTGTGLTPTTPRLQRELRGPLELKVRGASPGTVPIRTGSSAATGANPCSARRRRGPSRTTS
uniref:Orf0 n=1 Tax=Streptomyces antibioticus TaxID=1890 RepID=Q0R4Q0_STRAT|nr:Orf0 [Streptomyces antibioticus]